MGGRDDPRAVLNIRKTLLGTLFKLLYPQGPRVTVTREVLNNAAAHEAEIDLNLGPPILCKAK